MQHAQQAGKSRSLRIALFINLEMICNALAARIFPAAQAARINSVAQAAKIDFTAQAARFYFAMRKLLDLIHNAQAGRFAFARASSLI